MHGAHTKLIRIIEFQVLRYITTKISEANMAAVTMSAVTLVILVFINEVIKVVIHWKKNDYKLFCN